MKNNLSRKEFEVLVKSEASRAESSRKVFKLWLSDRLEPVIGVFADPISASTFTLSLPNDHGHYVLGEEHQVVTLRFDQVVDLDQWTSPVHRLPGGMFA